MVESLVQSVYRRMLKPALWRYWRVDQRALPDFLIIGSMRSGTTSLHDILTRHPGVFPAIKKEIHYFDLEFARGERWYRAHFPFRSILKKKQSRTGEASPYYLSYPHTAARAVELLPDARLIAVLRNPIDRAYSHYWHSIRLGVENLSFEEALEAEPDRLEGELEKLEKERSYISRSHIHHAYATRSLYANELARWLKHYPREQLLVIGLEELQQARERVITRLYEFLSLAPIELGMRASMNRAEYPQMAEKTRQGLQEFFKPHNRQLFELVGESFDWSN